MTNDEITLPRADVWQLLAAFERDLEDGGNDEDTQGMEELGGRIHAALVEAVEADTWTCDSCGSSDVQVSYPVWMMANDLGQESSSWEPDWEANPESDSDKCWCIRCEGHRSLSKTTMDPKATKR